MRLGLTSLDVIQYRTHIVIVPAISVFVPVLFEVHRPRTPSGFAVSPLNASITTLSSSSEGG